MKGAAVACAAVLFFFAQGNAEAGHEAPFYPSFYPQEIRIETLDPAAAAAGWPKALVHAYAGDDLFAVGRPPADAAAVTSLRSFLVLTFDAPAGRYGAGNDDPRGRCSAAAQIVSKLAPGSAGYVFHPYPVNPYHADYLEQFDLAQAARVRYAARGGDSAAGAVLRIRAKGPLAKALLPAQWKTDRDDWDATLEEVGIGQLAAPTGAGPGGMVAPPWIKQGWFQAYRLYAGRLRGDAARTSAEAIYRRLVHGDYRDPTERANLERSLVSTLVAGCERVVVGYTLRREYFNADYSNGVENVGFDSQAGFASPVFPRTVKLKDFPWNGWLRVGIATKPASAWNPISGFNDAFGHLLWLTLSDPALLPAPYGGSWIPNRVGAIEALPGKDVPVPEDALRPEPGTGLLRPVGPGKTAAERLRFSVVASAFHDGAATGVADILYPYIFAFHWGVAGPGTGDAFDPAVARSSALMREWLAGFKVIEITTKTRNYGSDLKFSYREPVVDVYLNHRSSDPWEAAAVAPPWSTLPWEVMVLMEEAVRRGIAAFSEAEAQRRAIPWLDLVRDRGTGARLAALVDRFRLQGYRPDALKQLVSVDEARERWTALARFYAQHGHFLVTNGPYRLDSWSPDSVVLQVFRDLSYPLGVGAFDHYAIPLRAYASAIADRGDRVEIGVEVEQVSKFQRSYEIVRQPLGSVSPDDADEHEAPECRYVVVGPDGKVARAGAGTSGSRGRFFLDLKGLPGPGLYTVMTMLYLEGNSVNPEIKVIEHRVAGRS